MDEFRDELMKMHPNEIKNDKMKQLKEKMKICAIKGEYFIELYGEQATYFSKQIKEFESEQNKFKVINMDTDSTIIEVLYQIHWA